MTKKILSFFLLLLALAYFDKEVHLVERYNVNLDVLYFSSWHAFAIFVAYIFASETRNKIYRMILFIISVVLFFTLYQNLTSINTDYVIFKTNVNDFFIDIIKWKFLYVSLCIYLLWEGLKLLPKLLR